jgi:hypothetical protein
MEYLQGTDYGQNQLIYQPNNIDLDDYTVLFFITRLVSKPGMPIDC